MDYVEYINFQKYHFWMHHRIMIRQDTPYAGEDIDEGF
jgi:hypothetical protein